MATLEQKTAWLAEAESARHRVALGQRVEVIMYGAKSITYGKTNLADLDGYIRRLQVEIARESCQASRGRVVYVTPSDGCR